MHLKNGSGLRKRITERIEYAINPDKTEDMKYVSSYACNPQTVDREFMLSKQEYFNLTGRVNKNDIIAYQLRQSFKPGEVTPEEANAISYELASRLLKGQYAFIVATHVDKKHIHSHIIFNSTALDCTHKYQNPIGSYRDIRRLADQICQEHKLSVISNPGPATPSYGTGDKAKKRISNREVLRTVIDRILTEDNPKSFDDFIRCLEEKGYDIKLGKYIAAKGYADKKYIRFASLGDEYTEEFLRNSIGKTRRKRSYDRDKPALLIDIQKVMNEGKGIGYQNWVKVFNLKQMARAYSYLQENNLRNYDELEAEIIKENNRINELQSTVDSSQKRLDDITLLKKNILTYAQNNDLYKEYKSSKYSKQFYEKNKENIDAYINAKHYFDSLNLDTKLPKIKDLNEEFQEVLKIKREAFNELLPLKREYRKHLIYRQNVKVLLNIDHNTRNKARVDVRE